MAAERGYVMVATADFATALLGFLGLATDVGYLQWQKMRAQTAADAAAAGAGLQLLEGGGDANIVSEGQTDAALNGFTNGASNTTVTVNHPPLAGSQAGNRNAVEVTVQRTVPIYFMSVIGSGSATVSARAVTVLGNSVASGCVDTMNPSSSKAFQVTGSVTVDFYCGIQVASASASAMFVGGTSIVYDNRSVGVVGGVTLAGKGEILNYLGQPVTPQKISAPIDPLSNLHPPPQQDFHWRAWLRLPTIRATFLRGRPYSRGSIAAALAWAIPGAPRSRWHLGCITSPEVDSVSPARH